MWSFMWTLGLTVGAEGRGGNCCQPLLGSSSLPFSLLFRLSQEPGKKIPKKNRLWEYINLSQILECRNWEQCYFLEYMFQIFGSVYCSTVFQGKQTVGHDLLYAENPFFIFVRRKLQIFIWKFFYVCSTISKKWQHEANNHFRNKCLYMSPYKVPALFYIVQK